MGSIVFEGVRKSFGGTEVIKGVSFRVSGGEVVALLGPNGSGKSTLFRMTVGVVVPDAGRVEVAGVDPSADPVRAREVVGYVPEEPVLWESISLGEYLSLTASIYGVDLSPERYRAVLKVLGLEEHAGKLVGELSHGARRKAMIAAVMIRDPKALVLDEVFSGLDVASARAVKGWLREMAGKGVPALFSTHILPIAEVVADRVVVIAGGKVVADGSPDELKEVFSSEGLEEVYLKLTGYSPEVEAIVKALARGA